MKKLMSNSIVDKFKLKNEREEKEKKRYSEEKDDW